MKKIFGFALSKTMNTNKAEELASGITFDVYQSLLKIDSVQNIDGYVYRVAQNVYARFVNEEVRGRHISLNEVRLPCENDFTIDFEKTKIISACETKSPILARSSGKLLSCTISKS